MKKGWVGLLTVLCLLLVLPTTARAVPPAPNGGVCGENATWTMSSGVLTISGSGSMTDYDFRKNPAPWPQREVEKIVIEDGITTIGSSAFHDCVNAREVHIPDSVTKIGSFGLALCSYELTELTLPDGITEIGEGGLYGLAALTHFDIPAKVTAIAPRTFGSCKELRGVTIHDGVTAIGDGAFTACYSLEHIDIPDSVTQIGRQAFLFCENLREVRLSKNITEISDRMFRECTALTQITLPAGITRIGGAAFGLTGLIDINIPEGVTEIGDGAFSWCQDLIAVRLPDSLLTIGDSTFECCSNLRHIDLPTGLTRIGDDAFRFGDLREIFIPPVVTYIGEQAFFACADLSGIEVAADNPAYASKDGVLFNKDMTELLYFPMGKGGVYEIPATVQSTAKSSFGSAYGNNPDGYFGNGINALIVPKSIEYVGYGSFSKLPALTDIYYYGNEEDWARIEYEIRGSGSANDSLEKATKHYNYIPATAQQTLCFATPDKLIKSYGTTPFVNAVTNASENGGTITYTSNNLAVATVDETSGEVTIVGVGEVVITATAAEVLGQFAETSISYTLTVVRQSDTTGDNFGNNSSGTMPAPTPDPEPDEPTLSVEQFIDVKPGMWYYGAVKYALENGLFYGTSDTAFSPNDDMTRGMLATILYRLAKEPETAAENSFSDVADGKYYTEAIAWAAENKIVAGYRNNLFGPEDSITREQLATILWRYAGSPESTGSLDKFTDGSKTAEYAVPALQWAVEQGIVSGKGNGILDPRGQATRAEVATMLMRYCETL